MIDTCKFLFYLLTTGLIFCVMGCGGGKLVLPDNDNIVSNGNIPIYKIGETGPGGGIIFFNEGGWYKECSGELGSYNWHDALRMAQDYKGGDFTDWRLPDKNELDLMYQNLYVEGLGDLFNGWYWSSSHSDYNNAWKQNFNNGNQSTFIRLNSNRVRAVRVFGVDVAVDAQVTAVHGGAETVTVHRNRDNFGAPNVADPTIKAPNVTGTTVTTPTVGDPNVTGTTITDPTIKAPNVTGTTITDPTIKAPNVTGTTVTTPTIKTFNVTFNSDGGSVVAAQTVTIGGKVTVPQIPTKVFTPVAGLYQGTLLNTYTFAGWRKPDNTAWNFETDIVNANITLKAAWSAPVVVEDVPDNDVVAAITHINSNPNTYTLLIDRDINLSPQTLDRANVNLTLIGIGREREIRLAASGTLFTIGASGQTGINLTLGNNITLVGRSAGGNGNTHNNNTVVTARNGASFVMLDGSKITGNTSIATVTVAGSGAAVLVIGGSIFTMKGGIITGNAATITTATHTTGGVFVTGANSVFTMEGGRVSGNTAISDVFIVPTALSFTLSGTAEIGTLTLNAVSTAERSVATVASGWTGSVARLNLWGGSSTMSTVIGWWYNASTANTVLQAAKGYTLTIADVAKFPLWNFISNAVTNNTQAIGTAHGEADNGFMINNLGQLGVR